MNSNYIKLWLRDAFLSASSSFASVSVMSAFFLRGGMNNTQISYYMAFTQAVNLAVSLLFAGITGKFRNTRRSLSVLYAAGGAVTFLFTIFCAVRPPAGVFFTAMLATGGLLQATAALRFVFEYKIPCEVIDIGNYSTYVAFSNIFGGGAGLLAGITLAVLFGKGDFMTVTAFAFIGSGICLLITAALNSSLTITNRTVPDGKVLSGPVYSFLRLMKNRDFRSLAIPNFIRGFGMGTVALITVLAIPALGLGDSDVPLITAMTCLGTLFSCLIYAFSAKKFGPALSCLAGSLIFCILPLSFFPSKEVFFTLFLAAYTGYNIVCCAIPDMVYRMVPADTVAAFHTWRMALTTLGSVISTAVIGMISAFVPGYCILAGGAAAILICSARYYFYYKKTYQS